MQPGWLDYDSLYVFGKSLFQPEYKIIKKAFEEQLPKEKILELFSLNDFINEQGVNPIDAVELAAQLNYEKSAKRENHPLLPRSIRGIIIGKSGCGKTTLLLNLLLQPGWLDYDSLYVFGKSLFQPEYKIIRKAFEEQLPKEKILELFALNDFINKHGVDPLDAIEVAAQHNYEKSGIECKFFESADDVPDPRELNPSKKNLMIFDDLQLEKQSTCEKYYVRGRHSNVDCFYLAQNYFKLPRQTIRENSNFICLFQQDVKNINHIYNDHVSIDGIPKEEFRKFCKRCWEKPHNFIVIDLSSPRNGGKYRSGFDEFYIPNDIENTN